MLQPVVVAEEDGTPAVVTPSDHQRWKSGTIDYLGRDCFANIQARLDSILNGTPAKQVLKLIIYSVTTMPLK